MILSSYPKKEIIELLLLLSVVQEEFKKKNICVDSIDKWQKRANEALREKEEEDFIPEQSKPDLFEMLRVSVNPL